MARKKEAPPPVVVEETPAVEVVGSALVFKDRAGPPRVAQGSEGKANLGAVTDAARGVVSE